MSKKTPGITLIELIMAISLLSVIALGLLSIDLFSRNQVLTSERRSKLQNEVSYTLEHMSKNIGKAIGDPSNFPVVLYSDGKGCRIKTDTNGNGLRDDDTQDLWIAYRQEGGSPSGSEIHYYSNVPNSDTPPPVGGDVVATNVVIGSGLQFTLPQFPLVGTNTCQNCIGVAITCRWQPDQPKSIDNPEIKMISQIKMPQVSPS